VTKRDDPQAIHSDTKYVFDNAGSQTPLRFGALAVLFDKATIQRLELGVTEGWRCLEVGAGPGSIAVWLSNRVGRSGEVVATDIDTRFLDRITKPNLKILRHDLTTEPFPEKAVDLVHTRLVLEHLPQPDDVLRNLVSALKSGGWLLVEEFDARSIRPDPAANPAEIVLKTFVAMKQVMSDRRVHMDYGRLLPGQLRSLRLVDVTTQGRLSMWSGGSPGADLLRANFEQIRDAMIAAGLITEQEFEEDVARLNDPDFLMPSPIMWSVSGRRP
jgi:ubiquinone/menaquinone biosynthesis C-methylase UbiE